MAFAKFLGVFVPAISDQYALFGLGGWSFTTQQLVALAVIILLTGINCMGISMAKMIQTSFTIIKVIALFLLILIGIFATFSHHQGVEVNISRMWEAVDSHGNVLSGFGLIAALSLALVSAFASDARNNVTFAGEEVKGSEKTLPRSLILGTALVCMLISSPMWSIFFFFLSSAQKVKCLGHGTSIQYAIGTEGLRNSRFRSDDDFFRRRREDYMAIAIMISTFGALNGLILSGPRLYYAMAKDRSSTNRPSIP
ncbi:MAG: amino acid permease [Cyanobacteriota/Melainabacteria group bacterium]